uniref:AT1G09310 protein n=1 Tax=Arabidopsis thaliana TaxID=3702 RepID=C0Z2C6_ARATH|nr:AT1G09310 [Arabidopsis thaliana]
MGLVTEEVRAKAEMYTGDEICREKTKCFLKEISMPNGLLPLKDIEEVGYDRESGVVWLKQKKSITHKFTEIDKLVSYGTEVTAFIVPEEPAKEEPAKEEPAKEKSSEATEAKEAVAIKEAVAVKEAA